MDSDGDLDLIDVNDGLGGYDEELDFIPYIVEEDVFIANRFDSRALFSRRRQLNNTGMARVGKSFRMRLSGLPSTLWAGRFFRGPSRG